MHIEQAVNILATILVAAWSGSVSYNLFEKLNVGRSGGSEWGLSESAGLILALIVICAGDAVIIVLSLLVKRYVLTRFL
jgi:hypothetical protein